MSGSRAQLELVAQAEVLGDPPHVAHLVGEDEADADAAGPGAAGAADAVDVSVAILGRVVVDDVGDVGDVDPSRGDVGRDQRVDVTRLEVGERASGAGTATCCRASPPP